MSEVRASHLLVKTEEEAKELREEILNGRKFEDVAAEVSLSVRRKRRRFGIFWQRRNGKRV